MLKTSCVVVSILTAQVAVPAATSAAAAQAPVAAPARLDLQPVIAQPRVEDLLLALQALLLADEKRSAVRCEADSTPVAAVSKEALVRNTVLCTNPVIKDDQRQVCRDALKAVRQSCDDACAVFEKLDANESPNGISCTRDRGSRTTAVPGCVATVLGTTPPQTSAKATCSASIVCVCDP